MQYSKENKKNSFDVLPYGSVLVPMDGYQFQGVISLQKLLANQDGVSINLLARTRKSLKSISESQHE